MDKIPRQSLSSFSKALYMKIHSFKYFLYIIFCRNMKYACGQIVNHTRQCRRQCTCNGTCAASTSTGDLTPTLLNIRLSYSFLHSYVHPLHIRCIPYSRFFSVLLGSLSTCWFSKMPGFYLLVNALSVSSLQDPCAMSKHISNPAYSLHNRLNSHESPFLSYLQTGFIFLSLKSYSLLCILKTYLYQIFVYSYFLRNTNKKDPYLGLVFIFFLFNQKRSIYAAKFTQSAFKWNIPSIISS